MKIKPGMMCRVVCNHNPGQRDHIVIAKRLVTIFFIEGWIVDAPWGGFGDTVYAAACLRPIVDPDIDLGVNEPAVKAREKESL